MDSEYLVENYADFMSIYDIQPNRDNDLRGRRNGIVIAIGHLSIQRDYAKHRLRGPRAFGKRSQRNRDFQHFGVRLPRQPEHVLGSADIPGNGILPFARPFPVLRPEPRKYQRFQCIQRKQAEIRV